MQALPVGKAKSEDEAWRILGPPFRVRRLERYHLLGGGAAELLGDFLHDYLATRVGAAGGTHPVGKPRGMAARAAV